MRISLKKLVLLVGDWAGLYASLFLLMLIRYGADWEANWDIHLRPFSLVFPLWIVTLYGTYLYETRFLRFNINTLRVIGTAIAIALVISILAFYVFPPGLIYPRRNMVIFGAIYGAVLAFWRWLFSQALKNRIKTNVVFIGGGTETDELLTFFKDHPHLGYETKGVFDERSFDPETVERLVREKGVRLIVAKSPHDGAHLTKHLFQILASGATIIDLEEFYERTLNKVSPEMLNDPWFIRNLENMTRDAYQFSKRALDIAIALLGLVFLSPFLTLAAVFIKLDSKGPVLYKQERVGKQGKVFTIYKLRTMRALAPDGSAETEGAVWADPGRDARVTRVGKILRRWRIDEVPQLWNVLTGDMSFVGPRPERPEFVKELRERIPYYDMRHLVRPGMTGWAQINYGYGKSVEDARIKLQYDIYYARNRSIVLDLAIIVKSMKILLTTTGS